MAMIRVETSREVLCRLLLPTRHRYRFDIKGGRWQTREKGVWSLYGDTRY